MHRLPPANAGDEFRGVGGQTLLGHIGRHRRTTTDVQHRLLRTVQTSRVKKMSGNQSSAPSVVGLANNGVQHAGRGKWRARFGVAGRRPGGPHACREVQNRTGSSQAPDRSSSGSGGTRDQEAQDDWSPPDILKMELLFSFLALDVYGSWCRSAASDSRGCFDWF